ncbi:MAG: Crp/Fnr family transcriptional regulator [Tunicatimonas sp.]
MTIVQYIYRYVSDQIDIDVPLPFATHERSFDKNEVITAFGQVESQAYYLMEGLVEISLLEDGQEKIIDFFSPYCFFSSYTSFLTQAPSDAQVVALANCRTEVIAYDDLQRAYRSSLLANQLGRYVTEQLYINRIRREKEFLTKSAEQRYRVFLDERPDLVSQVPVHKIAKYLGIHPESLSRIRKQITF